MQVQMPHGPGQGHLLVFRGGRERGQQVVQVERERVGMLVRLRTARMSADRDAVQQQADVGVVIGQRGGLPQGHRFEGAGWHLHVADTGLRIGAAQEGGNRIANRVKCPCICHDDSASRKFPQAMRTNYATGSKLRIRACERILTFD